ncbi:DUF2125 domain-containing protein [Pararhizobium gei]|uniref:DUF2125 domain-containing protein n=1 Tax=Pararhizobium gei TaxID=1395951 RepID=UPI0023D9C8C9|nr:DUF2125 domain-containing protein [Rhizobium gei]
MTTTEIADTHRGGRKIKWLSIAILLFLATYSGAWYLAADQIRKRLPTLLDANRQAGTFAECDKLDVRGFPFRIGVFCERVRLDNSSRGASATFGALRSAAQVYQPGHAVIELDGPAEIRVAPVVSLSADWSLLHASIKATLSGLDRSSLTYDNLAGTALLPPLENDLGTGVPLALTFGAGHGEAHFRQNGTDLDAAMTIEKFDARINKGPSLLPPLNGAIDLTLIDRAGLMNTGGFAPGALHDSTGEMRNLSLDLGNGMVTTATGPFSINDQGLISGEFSVTMKNIEGWRQNLVKVFSNKEGTVMINNIANMLTALADGKNEATVKLNVRDGIAFLAFFPIGELPQL